MIVMTVLLEYYDLCYCFSMYICHVLVPPFVRPIGPSTVIAIEHESVRISFEIVNAHPLVEASGITWRFNDATLLNDLSTLNGAVLSFTSDRRTLIISDVTYEIEGQYFFSAFNGAGRGSNLITVNVEGKYNVLCT